MLLVIRVNYYLTFLVTLANELYIHAY